MTPKPHSDPHGENALLCACHRKEQLMCPCGAPHYMERRNLEEQLEALVLLVRIGFLVTVGGERATAATVENPRLRAILLPILQAEDTAAAVASIPASRPATVTEAWATNKRNVQNQDSGRDS